LNGYFPNNSPISKEYALKYEYLDINSNKISNKLTVQPFSTILLQKSDTSGLSLIKYPGFIFEFYFIFEFFLKFFLGHARFYFFIINYSYDQIVKYPVKKGYIPNDISNSYMKEVNVLLCIIFVIIFLNF
jgi:hypothetical protein